MRSPRRATVRYDDGFGLIELLIALTVLAVGLFAMLVVFTSAKLALTRTDKVATAAVIADQQMERYRALEYSSIALNDEAFKAVDARYKADVAYPAVGQEVTALVGTCKDLPDLDWCQPTRIVNASSTPPSPDGRSYRVDTYIDFYTPTTPAGTTYPQPGTERRVTIVVRDGTLASLPVLARESSVFDSFTGSVDANAGS